MHFFLAKYIRATIQRMHWTFLPRGIEEHYENYFQRLERELKTSLEISDDKFLSFLSVLALAKESLPEALAVSVFGFEGPVDAKRKTRKAINALSSLLVIHKDNSLSFIHKSVRDWLVDHPTHNFTVDIKYGHKILFELCIKKLNDVKEKSFSQENLAIPDIKYALKYCIPHMLKGLEDAGSFESFVSDYFTDLEVVFAGVCVNVNLALDNLKSLKSPEIFTHVSDITRAIVEKLYFLIRKFAFSLGQYPQTFLQNVVNEAGEPLSSKATKLLETRHKHILYLKVKKDDGQKHAIELSCNLSSWITSMDVSPKHDFVVCAYAGGVIELFSLETGLSEWKIEEVTLKFYRNARKNFMMMPHSIVFHPRENLILPGRLDKVLTLQGEFTKGPFHCDQDDSAFSNSCFSLDGSKMVTNYRDNLIVWDVDSGVKETHIPCYEYVNTFSFTASGNFLGTIDSENYIRVYDVANEFKFTASPLSYDHKFPVQIVSTYEQNSWLCFVEGSFCSISHDLTLLSKLGSADDVAIPGNLHSSGELQRFFKNQEQSWLSRIGKNHAWCYFDATRYIPLGNKSVLVFSCGDCVMRVFNVDALTDTNFTRSNVSDFHYLDISTNGDYVYLNDCFEEFTVTKLEEKSSKFYSQPKHSKYVVVKDGIISFGLPGLCTPVLWSSDFTQQLLSFHQLAGMNNCLSVSDEVIACVYDQKCVIFFNISTKQIVHEMSFDEGYYSVKACSIKYHVLADKFRGAFLWKNGKKIDAWTYLFSHSSIDGIYKAEFSPEGNTLAVFSWSIKKFFIFDVVSTSMLAQISFAGDLIGGFKFFDEKNLIYSFLETIYCINVERGEILACLNLGVWPSTISVCRKLNIVCAGLNQSGNFQLLEVVLPRM